MININFLKIFHRVDDFFLENKTHSEIKKHQQKEF